MNNINKLIIGSVQFGLKYGINNRTGQVCEEDVRKILTIASEFGINKIDTSSGYGESELILGKILNNSDLDFNIISKYSESSGEINSTINQSLLHFKKKPLYGYLIHHFEYFKENKKILEILNHYKKEKKILKLGFSLYNTSELDYLLENNISFDLIQMPYNIFDRQFEPYFKILKKLNKEVHTRSVFLQGLFFKPHYEVIGKIKPLSKYLKFILDYCSKNNISLEALALNYVIKNELIDGILVGLDNPDQLKRNVNSIIQEFNKSHYDTISSIVVKENNLLNPRNW